MFYLGCSGWYYDHWKGSFYPDSLQKAQWLSYYSEHFSTVEINASFYRLPLPDVVSGWHRKTPDDFIFAAKGNRKITHIHKLKITEIMIDKFHDSIVNLRGKLGVILWQLPPSLKYNKAKLERFLSELDPNRRNAIEFRDASWLKEETYKLLRKKNIAFVITSAPGTPDEIEQTADFAYIRFHGTSGWYTHDYSARELDLWAERIKALKGDVYAYFNNDASALAVKNCMQQKKMLE